MGFTQGLTGVNFLFPPKPIGFLGQLAEHWVGVHLPEHSGFAKAAGLGVGQSFGL